MRYLIMLAVGASLAYPLSSRSAGERQRPIKSGVGLPTLPPILNQGSDQTLLPVGRWSVEFANQVTEVCEIDKDGIASVVEPVRIPGGKAVVNGRTVLIVFENGRVQRWTPVGKRLVVEHWFPGSQFPSSTPGTVGIAERIK